MIAWTLTIYLFDNPFIQAMLAFLGVLMAARLAVIIYKLIPFN
jgi:hypothetical protein